MDDNFPTKFAMFQYNVDLYEKVSLALTKTEKKIKLAPQTKKNAEGALALVCWSVIEPTEQATSRNVFYAEARNNQIVNASEIDARQVLASLIYHTVSAKTILGRLGRTVYTISVSMRTCLTIGTPPVILFSTMVEQTGGT